MGTPAPSALLPILRSDALARVLATVVLAEESLHIRAIADRTDLPYSVVQREVDRLESVKLVVSQRFAASRIVRPNESHPFYVELRALLVKAYGPRDIISEVLRDVPGIDEAFLYGSWAARYAGEWGDSPADVDVLVIGNPERRRLEEVEADAEDRLGRPVQITVASASEWNRPRSGLIRTIKTRPLVRVEFRSNR